MADGLIRLKYWAVDVDGTLTDGSVCYDNGGNEWKKFSVKDGIIFDIAAKCGMEIWILTGRAGMATVRRMRELHVGHLYQNIRDKRAFLVNLMSRYQIQKQEIGYIGDDLNDLGAMQLVGFVGCPADACEEIKAYADYISDQRGGNGAVRDIISFVLKEQGMWEEVLRLYRTGGATVQ